ncbi:MAG: hypothetical protein ABGY72_01680 [bacterium]
MVAPALLLALGVSAPAWAQTEEAAPTAEASTAVASTAVDALQCWRRLGQNAVRVGERFTMTVTCSTVETDRARTILDPVVLEPASIDVTPFEVLDGERFEEVRTGPFRFFQYRYTVRLITETSFGEDVELPALELTYRIERRLGNDPALVGREFTYILPPESIRIVSLVPNAVVDIRDLPPATFGDVQARVFRANALTLGAALLGVVAVGVLLLGAARTARARRGDAPSVEKSVSLPRIVAAALGELTGVQQTTAAQGWSVDAVARALPALRVAGSVALTGDVVQTKIGADTQARDGQLRVRHGLLGTKTVVISSGLTAAPLTATTNGPAVGDTQLMADLGQAVALFTRARYGRHDELPTADLTGALDTAVAGLKRLRWQSAAPVRALARLRAAAISSWSLVRLGGR